MPILYNSVKIILLQIYKKNHLQIAALKPNPTFQSQSIPTFQIPFQSFINSTSTEKLERNGNYRNTKVRIGRDEE